MIEVRNVSKKFGDKAVLRDISVTFEKRQTHVLLGASGSGKSTLLRMIMGLTYPDQGSVYIDGEAIQPQNQRRLARDIGYVLQEGGLFPHMNGYNNVTLVARLLDWSKEQIDHRLDELARLVGLEAQIFTRFPRQMSGGQRQRLAVMRAAFLDPKVLLLDEPLGALDPIVRSRLQTELRDIFFKLGKLVIVVTHDLAEAAYFGDTVSLLYEGQILQRGSFQNLLHEPASPYVTEFIQAQRGLYEVRNR